MKVPFMILGLQNLLESSVPVHAQTNRLEREILLSLRAEIESKISIWEIIPTGPH
jgi:hypothetical protein